MSCNRLGCQAAATHVPIISVPFHRLFKTRRPLELVLGLELCEAHAREVEGEKSELIESTRELLKQLNLANMRAGGATYDLTRAAVVAVELSDERYQAMRKIRDQGGAP